MELWKEILAQSFAGEQMQIVFPNLKRDLSAIVEGKCYQALQKIKEILEDDSLEDRECFLKIEEIVCVLESLGSNAGNRHDFYSSLSFFRLPKTVYFPVLS